MRPTWRGVLQGGFLAVISLPAFLQGVAAEENQLSGLPVPGTRADMVLQGDVAQFIAMLEHVYRPQCTTATLVQAEVVRPPSSSVDRTPWQERWSVDSCGATVRYDVRFVPDKDPRTGTTFAVGLSKEQ